MPHSQIELKTSWGETIYGNAWVVDKKTTPLANIVIAHGMAEYSFRYDEMAKFLNKLGYNVYAVDQPGHGLNVTAPVQPRFGLGIWPASGFKLAIDYLHELITNVRLNMLPTILFGHSMGSFVCQRYYQRFNGTINGLILSGSSANSSTFIMGRVVSKLMSRFRSARRGGEPSKFFKNCQTKKFNRGIPNFPDGYKSNNRWISCNEENVQLFDKDPLCGFTCSFDFYSNLFGGLKPTFQVSRVKDIQHPVPILLISGEQDPVGKKGKKVKSLEKFYIKGKQNVQLKLYPNMRHEIVNEIGREEVFADIGNHIAACISNYDNEMAAQKFNLKSDIIA